MFGVMAMFGAAYTLKVNEHVRVDLVYGNVSERMRTWIDLVGGILCLVPMCAVLAYLTWPWFVDSWHSGEINVSSTPGRTEFVVTLPISAERAGR